MRKLILFLCLLFFFPLTGFAKAPKVLISQVVRHPALDRTTQGIIDTLREAIKAQELTVRVESAQGNPALAAQIASKFIDQSPDVVVGVGTLSAQSFERYARQGKVKLVFSSVTDPQSAGLLEPAMRPYVTGVSNFVELKPQLELFQKLQPRLRRLGVLYNPGELNSVSIVHKLEKLVPTLGMTLVKQTATQTADVAQAAAKLANGADAIFISNDNTALTALGSIIKAARHTKIPVYVSDTDDVALGALAALGPNQYELGRQTGRLIVQILKGKQIADMPVEFPRKSDFYFNTPVAHFLGLPLPTNMRPDKVIPTP